MVRKYIVPILAGCIFLFSVGSVLLLTKKKSHSEKVVAQKIVDDAEKPQIPAIDTSSFVTRNEMKNFFTTSNNEKVVVGTKNRVDELESTVKEMNHRMWLLSLAVNENANLANNNQKGGFISFDKNWKMSKMPETLLLTEAQKAQLRKADLAPMREAKSNMIVQGPCNHHYVYVDATHLGCSKCNALYVKTCGGYVRCR